MNALVILANPQPSKYAIQRIKGEYPKDSWIVISPKTTNHASEFFAWLSSISSSIIVVCRGSSEQISNYVEEATKRKYRVVSL